MIIENYMYQIGDYHYIMV
jgi:hypothetical protein